MSERTLSDAIGIDAGAVEALGRAGVQTVQQLADADADAAAMASGIPVERIRDWQQKARGTAARPGPSPVAKGWMVAVIGVVIAILLGAVLIKIGSMKIAKADAVRTASEARLQIAVSYVAEEATGDLLQARQAITNQNWGNAQIALAEVGKRVQLTSDVAPDSLRDEVREAQQRLGDLQTAVGQQSPDASQKLDALAAALDKMKLERK